MIRCLWSFGGPTHCTNPPPLIFSQELPVQPKKPNTEGWDTSEETSQLQGQDSEIERFVCTDPEDTMLSQDACLVYMHKECFSRES